MLNDVRRMTREKMTGCACANPHYYDEGAVPKLLSALRTSRLKPDEEISAVAMFVRAWLDMRKLGIW
jgi:hypothetical protein